MLPIPERSYLPGETDPVFQRVIPTTKPVATDYAKRKLSPSEFILDVTLFLRAAGNQAALAFNIEHCRNDDPRWPLDLEKLAPTLVALPHDIPDALEFLTTLDTMTMDQWDPAVMLGPAADSEDSPILAAARSLLESDDPKTAPLRNQIADTLQARAAGESFEDIAARRIEDLRKRMRDALTPQPTLHTGGLAGRVGLPAPEEPEGAAADPGATDDELEHMLTIYEPILNVIQAAIKLIYTRDEKKVASGLASLDTIITHQEKLSAVADEVLAEVLAEHGRVDPKGKHKVDFEQELLEKTRLLRRVLDPGQTSDDDLIAIANALNVEFLEAARASHIEQNREHHGNHSDECFVREFNYDLFRTPYRRVVSKDPLIDNALPGLGDLAGVIVDSTENAVMAYALALHPAMAADAESALADQMHRHIGRVTQIFQDWAATEPEYMRTFDLRSTNEIIAKLNKEGTDAKGIPGGSIGAALTFQHLVFSPSSTQIKRVLDMLGLADADADSTGTGELTVPADWTGITDTEGGTE